MLELSRKEAAVLEDAVRDLEASRPDLTTILQRIVSTSVSMPLTGHVSTGEAAGRLGVSTQTVRNWAEFGAGSSRHGPSHRPAARFRRQPSRGWPQLDRPSTRWRSRSSPMTKSTKLGPIARNVRDAKPATLSLRGLVGLAESQRWLAVPDVVVLVRAVSSVHPESPSKSFVQAAVGGLFTCVISDEFRSEVTGVLGRPNFESMPKATVDEALGSFWEACKSSRWHRTIRASSGL